MEIIKNFNERIIFMRKALKKSQWSLGKLIGVSQRTISDWESGKYEPPDRMLHLMSQRLAVHYEWLKSGSGEMRKTHEEVIAEDSAAYFESEIEELIAYLKEHPREARLILRYIKAKREIKEVLADLEKNNLLNLEE